LESGLYIGFSLALHLQCVLFSFLCLPGDLHCEQHISKQDYVIVVEVIHISSLETQRWPIEFVISFSKVYFWDLALRFVAYSFQSHVIQI
jgi:hypothetical protein